ncbi:unnamed protein product [Ostreobium quekettii]|uniref:DNA alkylation repair protein n=1 Tax=Ostreobium quekettii TaxID=121088 RepID=A0A8S1J9X5_9CHLO|nr:unnamed protein product [Ostreobium quekettii]|eukprot:evm.model.scf_362EXC.10 EVM.evm.TU.scf_362EXC.10   scf_362EXC:61451-63273(+)
MASVGPAAAPRDLGASLGRLQAKLEGAAVRKTKDWFEGYLRHVITYRGVKTAVIRRLLGEWCTEEGLGLEEQKRLAYMLMKSEYAEDKFASAIMLQSKLIPGGVIAWQDDLPIFAGFFDDGHIWDWSTCDWFCIRVLGMLVERQQGPIERERCARSIGDWRDAENLWRRRAACVSFVYLAKRGNEFFPGFQDMLLAICSSTIRSPERFHQTGTGWLLREIGTADKHCLLTFCELHIEFFSSEGLRYALEKVPKAERNRFLNKFKASGAAQGLDARKQGAKRKQEER